MLADLKMPGALEAVDGILAEEALEVESRRLYVGGPVRAPQFFRTGTGHQIDIRPLASTISSRKSASMRGGIFHRFKRSFAFATAPGFARHPD